MTGRGPDDGRGALPVSHQPNVPGFGIVASYGARFWILVAAIGVATGLAGALLLELLRIVEEAAWSTDEAGSFLGGVEASSPVRHVVVLVLAGAIAGGGALLIQRASLPGGGEVSEALWLRDAKLPLRTSLARAVLSIVTVGMGSSLGREAAPQLAGAAVASSGAQRLGVPAWQRRLLVACGAGAGMAAVYNVPLGGALFALEVLLGTVTLPLVLPALATTAIATATAWVTVPTRPTYEIPLYGVEATQVAWAVVVGPVAGLAAVLWVRMIARVNGWRPRRRGRVLAPVVVLGVLGAVAIEYPQLLGNGLEIVQLSLTGQLTIGLIVVLLVLKPLATAACLGSGAPGGLFTPTLAIGVLLGGLLGYGWSELWPGAPLGSYALIGGGAVLAAAMQGPLAATVLMFELTRHSDQLMVPMLIAIVGATIVARLLRAPSIYSARLGVTTSVSRPARPRR